MKKSLLVSALIIAVAGVGTAFLVRAQDGKPPTTFEYAIVRWEEPDLLFRNIPTRSGVLADSVHVGQQGVTIPKEALREEFCQTFSCNLMAKTGWEPFNLDGNRIIFGVYRSDRTISAPAPPSPALRAPSPPLGEREG